MVKFASLIDRLESGPIPKDEYKACLNRIKVNYDLEADSSLLKSYGLPIVECDDSVCLESFKNSYKDEVYCIVDIETNGNSPIKNQIIEIGAIKYKNGEVIDRFESYVYADFIPESITKLTNIEVEDLKNAPSLMSVLKDFKEFLGGSIFVAHNVNFDFNFISKSLESIGESELLNRRLCTVELAKRTIEAPRHGLGFLREHLEIDTGEHHRAYSDALSALKVLEECFKNIPQNVETTEDLIKFSKNQLKKRNNSTKK
jgi:DNA polymerase-3 subunit epsilon